METTRIVRYLDDLGRIVIPKAIRKEIGVQPGNQLEIFVENNRIVLVPYKE